MFVVYERSVIGYITIDDIKGLLYTCTMIYKSLKIEVVCHSFLVDITEDMKWYNLLFLPVYDICT